MENKERGFTCPTPTSSKQNAGTSSNKGAIDRTASMSGPSNKGAESSASRGLTQDKAKTDNKNTKSGGTC